MDPYTLCLAIGTTGTAVMALRGFGMHAGHGGHPGGSHGGPAHGGGHGGHAGHAAGAHAHAEHAGHAPAKLEGARFLSLLSPRTLFTFLVGVGATGLLAGKVLGGPVLLVAALAGGALFERFIVRPLWNFLFRFESSPALTLESAVLEEGRAEMDFDRSGQGLVSVDLDGQIVQLLGVLRPEDQELGVRVRRGGRIRIEAVDPNRNRCVVSYLGEGFREESE